MTTRFATHTYHSLDYYWGLLKALIALVERNLTHGAIAAALNDTGIPSPTGKKFNPKIVSNMLRHLRLPEEHRSHLQHAMLQLCFDGRLSREECLPLLKYRPRAL